LLQQIDDQTADTALANEVFFKKQRLAQGLNTS
jgi:hypothetical protein